MTRSEYTEDVVGRLWTYKETNFDGTDAFEEPQRRKSRPPVFRKECAIQNVLIHPDLAAAERQQVLRAIPPWKRQRWFRSMKSSQALAQSVFGNLTVLGRLNLLTNITSESGGRPFADVGNQTPIEMEHSIEHLGEVAGRRTEVDVLIEPGHRIAVECKFTESNVGQCSRPRLNSQEIDYCNGDYSRQMGRSTRCSLTEIGVKYWKFIPEILNWNTEIDRTPCLLNTTYQLVRNVLAACLSRDGAFTPNHGVAVLLVDERNPGFQVGEKGRAAYDLVKQSLRRADALQLCTWQAVLASMRTDRALDDLTKMIHSKYGI